MKFDLGTVVENGKRIPISESKMICQYPNCSKQGEFKVDNGIPCGIYCNQHYKEMVSDARKKSW